MTEMYRVYDKNPSEPNALDIRHCFTEQGAQTEVERQARKGRHAAYNTFIPKCTWGSCTDKPCQNEAAWFDAKFDTYGAVCDEHYHPEWMSPKLRYEEMAGRELGGVTFNQEQVTRKVEKAGEDKVMNSLGYEIAPKLPGFD